MAWSFLISFNEAVDNSQRIVLSLVPMFNCIWLYGVNHCLEKSIQISSNSHHHRERRVTPSSEKSKKHTFEAMQVKPNTPESIKGKVAVKNCNSKG